MIERAHVLICSGSMCVSRGAKSLRDEFEEHLTRLGIREEIFYTRNFSFIVFPILTAYFAFKQKTSTKS